jgi:large subunit ribosomal protein L19
LKGIFHAKFSSIRFFFPQTCHTFAPLKKKEVFISIFGTMDAIKFVHEQLTPSRETALPDFRSGDNIVVNYKIIEGDKERIQSFRGDVIQIKGTGATKTFTVRKISNGVGVERIFPYASPNIVDIQVTKRGKVRRARLFYLRELTGKKSRIKERKFQKNTSAYTAE